VQLESWRERFEAIGVNVAGMTYDGTAITKKFHSEESLGFPLLQDENVKHVSAFGILNEDYEPGHRGYGIPHPGIFYLGPDGTILLKFAIPGYRQRPPLETVFNQVQEQID
jgi:peroxiredoxin